MKNQKAFTLVELIVIIVIIGVIMVFALPNVTSTLERNKKDTMIADAKDMIEKTKNYLLTNRDEYPQVSGECKTFNLDTLDVREEIKASPFGSDYHRSNSYVKVCLENSTYQYYVTITDTKNTIQERSLQQLSGEDKYQFD